MRILASAAMLLFLSTGPQAASADSAVVGDWLVADGTARIRIAPCGAALCGNVSWTRAPSGVDDNNPDPNKRNRPIIGLEILSGLTPARSNQWKAKVYNAKNGKTYDAVVSVESPDVLRIEGCVLGGLLCDGENWTRVKDAAGSSRPAKDTSTGSIRPSPRPAPAR